VFAVAEEVGDALRVEFEALERVHGPAVGQALREAVERMAKGWSARMTALAGTGPVAAAKGEGN
jgi:hypothetical protein